MRITCTILILGLVLSLAPEPIHCMRYVPQFIQDIFSALGDRIGLGRSSSRSASSNGATLTRTRSRSGSSVIAPSQHPHALSTSFPSPLPPHTHLETRRSSSGSVAPVAPSILSPDPPSSVQLTASPPSGPSPLPPTSPPVAAAALSPSLSAPALPPLSQQRTPSASVAPVATPSSSSPSSAPPVLNNVPRTVSTSSVAATPPQQSPAITLAECMIIEDDSYNDAIHWPLFHQSLMAHIEESPGVYIRSRLKAGFLGPSLRQLDHASSGIRHKLMKNMPTSQETTPAVRSQQAFESAILTWHQMEPIISQCCQIVDMNLDRLIKEIGKRDAIGLLVFMHMLIVAAKSYTGGEVEARVKTIHNILAHHTATDTKARMTRSGALNAMLVKLFAKSHKIKAFEMDEANNRVNYPNYEPNVWTNYYGRMVAILTSEHFNSLGYNLQPFTEDENKLSIRMRWILLSLEQHLQISSDLTPDTAGTSLIHLSALINAIKKDLHTSCGAVRGMVDYELVKLVIEAIMNHADIIQFLNFLDLRDPKAIALIEQFLKEENIDLLISELQIAAVKCLRVIIYGYEHSIGPHVDIKAGYGADIISSIRVT